MREEDRAPFEGQMIFKGDFEEDTSQDTTDEVIDFPEQFENLREIAEILRQSGHESDAQRIEKNVVELEGIFAVEEPSLPDNDTEDFSYGITD